MKGWFNIWKQVSGVSSSSWKEHGSDRSFVTTSKMLNWTINSSSGIHRKEEDTGRTAQPKMGETDGWAQGMEAAKGRDLGVETMEPVGRSEHSTESSRDTQSCRGPTILWDLLPGAQPSSPRKCLRKPSPTYSWGRGNGTVLKYARALFWAKPVLRSNEQPEPNPLWNYRKRTGSGEGNAQLQHPHRRAESILQWGPYSHYLDFIMNILLYHISIHLVICLSIRKHSFLDVFQKS